MIHETIGRKRVECAARRPTENEIGDRVPHGGPSSASRLVVCFLDAHHKEKIWPTFERECFQPRVADAEVFLDDNTLPWHTGRYGGHEIQVEPGGC